jgi:hypothetical protein
MPGQYKHVKNWRLKQGSNLKTIRHEEYLRNKQTYRNNAFKRTYGITFDDYDNMCVLQDYKCAICGISEDELTRKLAVDHNHVTGEVRGLLCLLCNSALGKFKDDKELLKNAIKYLKQYDGN